jgi:hypothetical protein
MGGDQRRWDRDDDGADVNLGIAFSPVRGGGRARSTRGAEAGFMRTVRYDASRAGFRRSMI